MNETKPRSGALQVCGLLAAAVAAMELPPIPAEAQTAAPDQTPQRVLPDVNIIAPSPLLGIGIDRDLVPAASNVLTDADIRRNGVPNATQALQDQTPGVNLTSPAGNPYQPTLLYHGFAASPLQGTPQGLAVYINGVRFNQPFGDTVNWDLIPDIAIARMNLVGSNPVFGLNALGGALNVQMKDGFTYQGGEVTAYGGSFGQVLGSLQYGKQSGNVAAYIALSAQHQNGWRDLQSSDLYSLYSDIGWQNDKSVVHVSVIAADSNLNGPGTSPVELLAVDRAAQFTAPNAISNKYLQVSLRGSHDISDTTSLQGTLYYTYFRQNVSNGNVANDAPCDDEPGLLCRENSDIPSTSRNGVPIPDFLSGGPYSQLDRQTTNTNGYGASFQLSDTREIIGRKNNFVAGLSFDGGQTQFDGASFIGGLTSPSRVFIGPGILINNPGANVPVRVGISNAYYGVFFSDTYNITPTLAATVSGRFNAAQVNLSDQNGGDISGNHYFSRFNPSAGLSWQVMPWLTAYASYSQSNRAPTPAELSCAGPQNSCSLANFFVGDPPLKQVVASTVEAGLRGSFTPFEGAKLTYNLGYFHTNLNDDIIFINSVVQGRAYFANVGLTRRQGVDAGLQLQTERWLAYLNYSYTNATFQSSFTEGGGNNPAADANGNVTVQPGAHLPGIPANQLKFGVQYKITDDITLGATGLAASGTYLFGDAANLTPKLPAYVTFNVNASYQITQNLQLFGLVQNVTNQKYYTFGTFSPTRSVFLAQAPNATNPRAYSPAAPIGGYAGLRMTF